jgi:hypothetical protein
VYVEIYLDAPVCMRGLQVENRSSFSVYHSNCRKKFENICKFYSKTLMGWGCQQRFVKPLIYACKVLEICHFILADSSPIDFYFLFLKYK